MALPDVVLKVLTAQTASAFSTSTDTAFYVAQARRGWTKKPRLCRSLTDVVNYFGSRLPSAYLYDWADSYFNEGGTSLYISRAIHSDAKAGKLTLKDSGGLEVIVVEAGSLGEVEPGAWSGATGSKLQVEVVNTGTTPESCKLKVYIAGAVAEESPTLFDLASLVGWANANSAYLKLSLGAQAGEAGAKLPANLAAKELTDVSASDGSTPTDADYLAALERIGREYGAGQVAIEAGNTGSTTRQVYALEHAAARNRYAVLDGADTATVATLIAQAQSCYTAAGNGRRVGEVCAPWDVIPGLTANTLRTVPPSARKCAQYARVDKAGNPNRAAAGARGRASYTLDLSQPAWSDQQRLELNNAGIIVSRRMFGNRIVTYGMRTLADQVTDPEWSMAPNVRTIMAFGAKVASALEIYEFDQVDGFGSMLGGVNSTVAGICSDLYGKGALYGATPGEAFAVRTDSSVNPVAALAKGEVTVEADLKVSPNAEQITIRIVKTPIAQAII